MTTNNQFEQRNNGTESHGELLEDKKRSKELNASRDILSGLLVTINTQGGKFRTKGDFAKREDIFRLRCYTLMTADKDEQDRAAKLYNEQSRDLEGPPTEEQIKVRAAAAKKTIEDTRDYVVPKIDKLFNFLIKLVGNSPLGGEPKNLIKLELSNNFDRKTGYGSKEGTQDIGDRKKDMPSGGEAYALSPDDMNTLKLEIKNTPACTIVSESHKGYFVAKFGEVPIIFAESGSVEENEDKKP